MATGAKDPGAFKTIGELSSELGVAQHILRYWETKFPQLRPLQRARPMRPLGERVVVAAVRATDGDAGDAHHHADVRIGAAGGEGLGGTGHPDADAEVTLDVHRRLHERVTARAGEHRLGAAGAVLLFDLDHELDALALGRLPRDSRDLPVERIEQ